MSAARKVLILEDSPMMCSLYRMVLGGGERDLLFAADGVEGLDRAAGEPDIGLYIVDVNMPRLDGIAFIRRLREELEIRAVPIVVVSTECGEGDKRTAFDAGADAYLCKPWEPEDLLDVIEGIEREAGP